MIDRDNQVGEVAPEGRSRRVAAAAVGAVLLVVAGVAYMILSSVSGGTALEYYLPVDEALAKRGELAGRRVRLHGKVVAGTLQKRAGALEYRFALFGGQRWIEVAYRGLLPDAFKDCAEVVVNGRLDGAGGAFVAQKVVAKCPSKYDEKAQAQTDCGARFKPTILARRNGSR